MAKSRRKASRKQATERAAIRRFRSRGVDVEIREAGSRVEVTLDGTPVEVEVINGEFHSQLANMFTGFPSIDELVDVLLANEGRTWTLHGHLCDERCGPGGHHHDHGPGHNHGDGHSHGRGSGR